VSLIPSKVGAERKQIFILAGLVLVLVIVFFINRTPDGPQPQAAAPVSIAPVVANSPGRMRTGSTSASPTPSSLTPMPPQRGADRRAEASIQDFKPTLKLPEGTDVSRIDPSLKLDLMAKLQNTPLEGGERSLFEFGAEPKPPLPRVNPVKPQPLPVSTPAVAATPAAPGKPAAPPIPLKFYGYVGESQGPSKLAFFLDGEDIVVVGENETIHNRYKVIRIGVNSAVVEDTTNKNQQTLPLVEELPG
jgi:hypothetical protein